MKKINIYLSSLCLAGLIGFSGCKDGSVEEITTLQTIQMFSPTGLSSVITNKTNVELNWKAVNGATSYTIEVFETADFSGTPFKSISNVKFTQLPYTVTGLSGETSYAIRVKAVGPEIADSKWVTASVKTDPEQIFLPVNAAKLTATSVTLNFPAGQTATTITLTPGAISRAVTPAEIAAGEIVLTGLTGETAYTAKLMNGTKTRGTLTFTTLLDLGGATAVYPTDNLATLMTNAAAGTVFALFPGTYNINADVTVTKSISIKGARPTDKPIINGMIVRLRSNAGFGLKDVVLDGTGSLGGNQAIIYDEASDNAYGNLTVENSVIKNYIKGLVYINLKTLIESVTFKGNLISNIECNQGDFIDFRNGIAKTLLFTENTTYNSCLARDFIRMDAGGSTNFPTVTAIVTVSNNTLNGITNGAGNRILYIRLAKHEIYFTKNIVANSGGILTNQASTQIVAANFSGNNYFSAPTYISGSVTSGAKYDGGSPTTFDPGFTAPATGNFTISNATLKANSIGDPRWRN